MNNYARSNCICPIKESYNNTNIFGSVQYDISHLQQDSSKNKKDETKEKILMKCDETNKQ